MKSCFYYTRKIDLTQEKTLLSNLTVGLRKKYSLDGVTTYVLAIVRLFV